MLRIPYEQMYRRLTDVLLSKGFSEERAGLCARMFTDASCDGVYTHGLNRFSVFFEYMDRGLIDIHAQPEKVESFGVLERWDGKLGPGNLNAFFCMDRAIELARQDGMGCVALRNTNHWMRAGTYGWQAAEAGCIGMCWTNTTPLMPPWGSRERRLGNNPIVFAVPRKEGHIVLDIAMTIFSMGKLQQYKMRNEMLPVDGGYDCKGKLTRDPAAIIESARPLPIGYWKGSGLALMLDLIAAILSGGKSTCDIGRHECEYAVSQVFIAFDISKLPGHSFVQNGVNEIVESIHSALPADENGKVYYPGERTLLTRKENLEKGIPVERSVWERVLGM